MSSLSIVITGCTAPEFRTFKERAHLANVECEAVDHELVCTLPAEMLETMFLTLEQEAGKGWQNPDRHDTLAFDSAFFPSSAEALQPVRQLRGQVAARLARKREQLPPARALPGVILGAAEK